MLHYIKDVKTLSWSNHFLFHFDVAIYRYWPHMIRKLWSRHWWQSWSRLYHRSGDDSTITVGRHLKGINWWQDGMHHQILWLTHQSLDQLIIWSVFSLDHVISIFWWRFFARTEYHREVNVFVQKTKQQFHPEMHYQQLWLIFSSLFASDLQQLGVFLHDVHQHVVDVAPQVQVHLLLVFQRLPHLKKLPRWKRFLWRIDRKKN